MNRLKSPSLAIALALVCPVAAACPFDAGVPSAGLAPVHSSTAIDRRIARERHTIREAASLHEAASLGEAASFREVASLIRKYARRYGFDWRLIMAQAYQESRFDQNARSNKGAVGVMQVLPTTAADSNVGIPDIYRLENNIHAGNKYLRFVHDHYFAPEPMSDLDKTLFALAAYNAGPTRVTDLRAEAARQGLDPNVWFGNVERIAARRIGRETVDYVSNIHRYWAAGRFGSGRLARPVPVNTVNGVRGRREPARLRPVFCRIERGGSIRCNWN